MEPPGSSGITVERHRFSRDRPAGSAAAATALSVLAHAAFLIAFTLLLTDRVTQPDIPGPARVAMVFDAAPTVRPPAVPAAPTATPATVPTPPQPTLEPAQTKEPPRVAQPPAPTITTTPEPPVPVAQTTAVLPAPPSPPPVRTASAAVPTPPVHREKVVPKVVSPPARTPPPPRETSPRAVSVPASRLASLTPSPAPTRAPPTEANASPAAAAAALIPPRPVAGMETNRAPTYPEIALRRGEAGRVMLRVSVSVHGRPIEVDVAQSSGYPILDSAALSAVRQWQFIPATQAGTPVAAIAEVPIRFQIDN